MRLSAPITLALLLPALACPDGGGSDAGAGGDAPVGDRSTLFDVDLIVDATFPHSDAATACDAVSAIGLCSDAGALLWCERGAVQVVDCTELGLGCGAAAGLAGSWCLAGGQESCAAWPCAPPLVCGEGLICRAPDDDAGQLEDRGS